MKGVEGQFFVWSWEWGLEVLHWQYLLTPIGLVWH